MDPLITLVSALAHLLTGMPTMIAAAVADIAAEVPANVLALGPEWLDPENILRRFGDVAFWVVLAIIFAECGLLIGFFLPGDSLIFITGLFIAQGWITMNIWLGAGLLVAAAILGNITGYWIGAKAGPPLFRRPDSRLFKQVYVERTHAFFDKYGARAIVVARFVPIVRTFITALAGVARMDYRTFVTFSAIGGLIWAGGVLLLGYFLGTIPIISNNIEIMLLLIVVASVIPIVWEVIKHRRARTAE